MCFDPLDPGRGVRGCSVGCTLAMSDISHLVLLQLVQVDKEFPEQKKCILKRDVLGFESI